MGVYQGRTPALAAMSGGARQGVVGGDRVAAVYLLHVEVGEVADEL